jgi:hypothetical protein
MIFQANGIEMQAGLIYSYLTKQTLSQNQSQEIKRVTNSKKGSNPSGIYNS